MSHVVGGDPRQPGDLNAAAPPGEAAPAPSIPAVAGGRVERLRA